MKYTSSPIINEIQSHPYFKKQNYFYLAAFAHTTRNIWLRRQKKKKPEKEHVFYNNWSEPIYPKLISSLITFAKGDHAVFQAT